MSNELEQSEFIMEKILGFRNMQEKLEKLPTCSKSALAKMKILKKNKSIGSFCGQNLSLLHFNSFVTLKY